MSLSVGQLRSQVRSALTKARAKQRDARRLGFYAPSGWSGPSEVEIDKSMWRIADARSPLSARELLASAPQSERLLVVCRVAEEQLGDDLMARFGVPRLLRPNPIETLKDQFQAISIDPRILANLFLVDVLSEDAPEGGFPPAANGHLTAEQFWGHLLSRTWGMPQGTPDLTGLLRWTLVPKSGDKFRRTCPEVRVAASAWIEQNAGGAAGDILRSFVEAGNPRPIVLGLACGVLFDASVRKDTSTLQAQIRIERFLGQQSIAADQAAQWLNASLAVMDTLAAETPAQARTLSRELDELLGLLQATEHASLSPWSQLGLDASFESLGIAIQSYLSSPTRDALRELFGRIDALRVCRLAGNQPDRITRAEMAVRLCSWLQTNNVQSGDGSPRSLPDAVEQYLLEQSFIDWARTWLYSSDPSPTLAKAIRQLLQATSPHRNRFNELYAGMLGAWTPSQDTAGKLTPIHKVLSRFVAPVSDASPVLLIVLDGMSAAVFNELVTDLSASGWRSIAPKNTTRALILAGVPSITELSRTSLLSGRLQIGGQPEELSGFVEHPELRQRSRSGSPRLFHKGALTSASDGNLSQEVDEAILSPSRFVGVVINAIDDHLAKGEQLTVPWTAERIRPLPSLLARARDAGRLIVVVSDHGHMMDQGTQQTSGSDSDRYRRPNPAAADGEVLINPAHTGLGVDTNDVVFAWSESLRYCGRKNGYHGGVSPQESVVPFAVLCHGATLPDGWVDSPVLPPAWWNGELQPVAVPAKTTKPSKLDMPLFEAPIVESVVPTGLASPAWLDRLLQSELFKMQRSRAGRNVPNSEEVARFVATMLDRGGKLTRPALARALNMPELRVGGYVSQIRRILNVEGYPIIHVHEESSTVELNVPLLKAQFDVT